MKKGRNKDWKEAWRFSARERRALLYLLPVLAVVSWLVWEIARPRFDDTFTSYTDVVNSVPTVAEEPVAQPSADTLFAFDPNTIQYHDLCRMGFTRSEALGIVKYRERGKVFEIPEDFASCYQVSEEMYRKLQPYINIGAEYKPIAGKRRSTDWQKQEAAGQKPSAESRSATTKVKTDWQPRPFSLDTITAAGLQTMGFSARQADVVLNYRDMKGGLRSADEFAECYVVSDEMFARLSPWLVFPENGKKKAATTPAFVNLNTADSATLRTVRGIGEKTVTGIIDYRRRLGGFWRTEQLAEIPGVTEQNYERIRQQIFVDSCDIQKIDINFASAKELAGHPYISPAALRKLLKNRQLKGGWSTTGELTEDKIFTPDEAEKLAPYLLFRTPGQ